MLDSMQLQKAALKFNNKSSSNSIMFALNSIAKKASPILFGKRAASNAALADSLKGLVGRNFLSIDELR